MKKVLLIMAAALMTMTQCRKQETVPATPSANTIKMTITAGPGAKTNIDDNGAVTWSVGDVLYVSDGAKWLGSLTLQSGAGNVSGTFTGTIQGIGDGTATCHFFYLGKGIVTTTPSGTTAASISFASQDGSKPGALKYHLGHGSADVTVSGGEATGAVAMRTEIAMAHLKLKMDDADYTGSVTMDVSNTMTVSPDGSFSGSGTDGITIGGTSGDRYVTLIPTGTSSVDVSFSGSATGSMTFGHGIQANNLYGMENGIEVTLNKVPVTGVSLDKTELSLEEGKTETLTATVLPDNATYKDVTWSSCATDVATVGQNGVVTAVKAGNATITVTTVDGGKTATCTVTVTAAHEYVDLGLSVKWATCNLGASKPEDYGDYYAWGEILPYYADGHSQDNPCSTWRSMMTGAGNTTISNGYAWATYSQGGSYNFVEWTAKPYGIDNVLTTGRDAASANWGGSWRMPTEAEFNELITSTTCTWTTENGVYGYKFTSWTGKYIFLPAAGYREGMSLNSAGSYGYYWSSSLSTANLDGGRSLYFYSGDYYVGSYGYRYNGFAVRPVCSPQN